ncbi:hypothetical protein BCON_0119g00230 [Botryotinia convoluta]|uniref:Uncharacterized protein n=1 Tax=Botryotinia convoluta TaxID=54673 RepID=A0A4Z1HWV3_9HELO|nr:hypothetical protein BCON_0119g00230 [Botryotinia convoluta]
MLEEHLAKCHETKNFKELARLDETVYTVVSSLAAMYQMLEMVRLRHPRAKKREAEDIAQLEHSRGCRYVEKHLEDQYLLKDYNRMTGLPNENIHMGESQSQRIRAEKLLADPTKKFMETPKPTVTRLSQQWLDTVEQQRKALRFGQEDIDHDLAILSADSDPEYLASIEKRNAEIHAEIAARHAKKVALPNTDDEKNSVEILSEPAATSATSAPLTSPKVLVRKSSYAIFQTMFPTRSFEERTKTVPWDSLVNCMAEARFVSSQSARGSAVQLEPDAGSPWFGQGKIVFHKPPPERVLDAVMLVAIGKRMEEWFGWSDETLEVGKK